MLTSSVAMSCNSGIRRLYKNMFIIYCVISSHDLLDFTLTIHLQSARLVG